VKRRIIIKKVKRSSPDINTFDREFWKKQGHEARFKASWEIVSESFLFKGEPDASKQRLQRSVQNIKRRTR
jgi:hypothetical protein